LTKPNFVPKKLQKLSEAPPAIAQIYTWLSQRPLEWGRVFFPHHFRIASPSFHADLINGAMRYRLMSVAAPRESAKSTMLVFLYPAHGIIFKRFRFIVLVSNTFKKAAMHLESIKKEITDNVALKESFPGITIARDAEGDSEFLHPDGFAIKFICRGVDQIGSIRGVKFGAYRPDLILVDDMEDDELVKNPQRRRDLQQEYDEALIPAGERGKVQIINVGTLLHDDCQMAKLVSPDHYREFYKLVYRAHIKADTPEERSLWPEKWSLEFLRDLRAQKPNVYSKEMQNDPVAGVNTRFSRSDFRYWKTEGSNYQLLDSEGQVVSSGSLRECKSAIACDLAWSEKKTADYCVLLPAFLTPSSEILVDTYIAKKGMRPDEFSEQLFLMVERLEKITGDTVPVGFEKAMLENVTQWLLKAEMKKRNKFLLTKQLVWDSDKNTRIEIRLQPRYTQHVVFHKTGMGELEHQLERFPYGAHDDLCDALQAVCQLLQYPKTASRIAQSKDEFMQVRDLVIKANQREKFHGFGKKIAPKGIPFKRSLW